MKKFIAILLVTFSSITTVNAASLCSYQEQNTINQKAANIKVSYEILTEKIESTSGQVTTMDYINVSLLNISEEFYVSIKNDFNSEIKTYNYGDTNNGSIVFRWDNLDKTTNFTIEIYTTAKTSCPNELYKTLYLLTPRRNFFGFSDSCALYPDFELCQKYVKTNSEITEENFRKKLEKFELEHSKKEDSENSKIDENDIWKSFKKYGLIILGVSVIIGAGIFIIVVNTKNKKQRELGL